MSARVGACARATFTTVNSQVGVEGIVQEVLLEAAQGSARCNREEASRTAGVVLGVRSLSLIRLLHCRNSRRSVQRVMDREMTRQMTMVAATSSSNEVKTTSVHYWWRSPVSCGDRRESRASILISG
jgi:hypothetical protein